MTKAIILKTGEVVTLRPTVNKDEDKQYYEILEDNHRVLMKQDIYIVEELWSFIEQYLPDYYHDERVADSDDIECCLASEANDEKLERVKRDFGVTPEQWIIEQTRIDDELFREAAANFIDKMASQK